ncbi:MAG: DUF1501 domain-containing protein [Gemmataceae bacterium]|nr:DUF1501 domain-containing protein [Gemmataceae bacterium]
MFRILGNPKQNCTGLTRRELLIAGGLAGLGAAGLPASPSIEGPPKRAKSVICLFLFGGWSQLETFDPKPDAPVDVRGPYKTIPSSLAGFPVCEHIPQIGRWLNRVSVVRSVHSNDANHNTSDILTGRHATIGGTAIKGLNPGIPHDWPYFMSAIHHLRGRQDELPRGLKLPTNMCVPNRLGLLEGYNRTGPFGGFLGAQHDPVCTRFGSTGERLFQPSGVRAGTLSFAPAGIELGPDVTLDHLSRRADLLQQFESSRANALRSAATSKLDASRQSALDLMTSDRFRKALDLSAEPTKLRDRYGWNLFGQSVLLSRRLAEAGVPLVTAIWDCTKEDNDIALLGWDTHWDHFKACEGWLLPGLDAALSSLLDDLEARGMMDDTLVVVLSEMGRTPKINGRSGRDHWVGAYCAMFAGAGIKPGVVYGKTDRIASSVTESPVSTQDLLATIYHLSGISSDAVIFDRQQRQMSLYGDGIPIRGILA